MHQGRFTTRPPWLQRNILYVGFFGNYVFNKALVFCWRMPFVPLQVPLRCNHSVIHEECEGKAPFKGTLLATRPSRWTRSWAAKSRCSDKASVVAGDCYTCRVCWQDFCLGRRARGHHKEQSWARCRRWRRTRSHTSLPRWRRKLASRPLPLYLRGPLTVRCSNQLMPTDQWGAITECRRKNTDFRNRAFAFLFADGANDELSSL